MVILTDYRGRNRVLVAATSPDVIGQYHDISLLESITGDTALAIDRWVTELELGRRVAYDTWQLKNRQAVELFVLRWS